MLLGPPDGLILHPAQLEPLSPRDASSPVSPAVSPSVSASGSESEPVNFG